MYGPGTNGPLKASKKGHSKLAKLIARYDKSAQSSTAADASSTPPDPAASKPWLTEFHQYLNGNDEVPDGMSIIKWWGVCISPVCHLNSVSYCFLDGFAALSCVVITCA